MTEIEIKTVRTMDDYPPGLIGIVAALFGRSIAATHHVDWTLDAMIAEQQVQFFRRFDPTLDRVWAAMERSVPLGGLTIDGPRPGRESAQLRFFILDEKLRGRGLGRKMLDSAIQFCRERGYTRVFLTTLAGLDAALHLYHESGFVLVSQASEHFHGSRHVELTFECRIS